MQRVTTQRKHFTVTGLQLYWFLCQFVVKVQAFGRRQGAIRYRYTTSVEFDPWNHQKLLLSSLKFMHSMKFWPGKNTNTKYLSPKYLSSLEYKYYVYSLLKQVHPYMLETNPWFSFRKANTGYCPLPIALQYQHKFNRCLTRLVPWLQWNTIREV